MTRKILINTSWLVSGQGVVRILKFLIVLYCIRIASIDVYGSFVYIFAYVSLFFILFSLFHTLSPLLRDMGSSPEEIPEIAGKHIALRLWIGGIALLCAVLGSFLLPNISIALVLILGASLFLDFMRDMFGIILLAQEKMKQESASLILQAVVLLGAVTALLYISPTVAMIAWSYFIASVLGLMVTIFYVTRLLPLSKIQGKLKIPTVAFLTTYIPKGFSFGLIWMLVFTLLFQFATFVTGLYTTAAIAGIVSIGFTVVQILLTPYTMLGTSLVPVISKTEKGWQDTALASVVVSIYSLVVFTGIGMAIIPVVIPMFLAESVWIARALILLIVFISGGIFSVCLHILLSRNQWKGVVIRSAAIAIIGGIGMSVSLFFNQITVFTLILALTYTAFALLVSVYLMKRVLIEQVLKRKLLPFLYLFCTSLLVVGAVSITRYAIAGMCILIVMCMCMYKVSKPFISQLTHSS